MVEVGVLHLEFWRSLPCCAVRRRNINYYTIARVMDIKFIAPWQAVNMESYVGGFLREDVTRLVLYAVRSWHCSSQLSIHSSKT